MAKTYYQAGKHWGRLIKQQLGEASTGNMQLVLTFVILGRVNPEDPEGDLLPAGEQYERSVFRTLTEKTIDWVLQDLDALDCPPITSWSQLADGTTDLTGRECALICEHSEWQGTVREKWGIAGTAGPSVKPLDQTGLRKLDALFGKALKARKAPHDKPIMRPEDAMRKAYVTAEPKLSGAERLAEMQDNAAETMYRAKAADRSEIPF